MYSNFLITQCGIGGKNQLDSSSRFDTIPACDRRTDIHTDRQTDRHTQDDNTYSVSIASRGKSNFHNGARGQRNNVRVGIERWQETESNCRTTQVGSFVVASRTVFNAVTDERLRYTGAVTTAELSTGTRYRFHTHTHPFNGPLSGTIRVSRYQKGKTNLDFTEARDSEWQWHQLVCVRAPHRFLFLPG